MSFDSLITIMVAYFLFIYLFYFSYLFFVE